LPDSMPTACLLHQLWWCKHAAYGIGLTLQHVIPLINLMNSLVI
jgi:hypothetical protein